MEIIETRRFFLNGCQQEKTLNYKTFKKTSYPDVLISGPSTYMWIKKIDADWFKQNISATDRCYMSAHLTSALWTGSLMGEYGAFRP